MKLKIINSCILSLFFISITAQGDELKLFTTDGCSSFPDGTFNQRSEWLNCCVSHDLAYWKGGTKEERLQADEALKTCVTNVGEPEIAKIMLAGVRVGGTPYLPTSFRWGYGWSESRGYKALSDEEKREVKEKLELLKSVIDSVLENQEEK